METLKKMKVKRVAWKYARKKPVGVEINSSEVSFEILFAAKFLFPKKIQILSFQYVGVGYDKNGRGFTKLLKDRLNLFKTP